MVQQTANLLLTHPVRYYISPSTNTVSNNTLATTSQLPPLGLPNIEIKTIKCLQGRVSLEMPLRSGRQAQVLPGITLENDHRDDGEDADASSQDENSDDEMDIEDEDEDAF